MDNNKTIEVLNTLITINNDRIEGYETAAKETEEQDLKTLFAQFSSTSQRCKLELNNEVNKLGGTPAEGTLTTGKYRSSTCSAGHVEDKIIGHLQCPNENYSFENGI